MSRSSALKGVLYRQSSLVRSDTNHVELVIPARPSQRWVPRVAPSWSPICSRRASSTLRRTTNGTTKPFYVTTPIFYVNAAPHVGHLYSMVLGDIIKRWNNLKGSRSILATGIDEHGMKVQRAASKASVEPLAFCDNGAKMFKELAAAANISPTYFVRTTSQQHKDAVQHAWQQLQDKELIYRAKHEGWYSVSDETFYPDSRVQLIVDPPTGRKIMVSTETGSEVEWSAEQNYHFRLSAFQEDLGKLYMENPTMIIPKERMNEIQAHIDSGLQDLSISRPSDRLTWGVPVPNDPSQTIYVWLDALLNYITILGYPWTPSESSSSNPMITAGWPADVQIVGKDIAKFHCIYWPAFLMALNLPLPKQILTHAHWTLSNKKMSKSTGNVVNPFSALNRFGIDTMRFYMASDGGIVNDNDYDNAHVIHRYKNDLQHGLGNVASRLIRSKAWNIQACVSRARIRVTNNAIADRKDRAQLEQNRSLCSNVTALMDVQNPRSAVKAISEHIHATQNYLHHAAPWALVTKTTGSSESRSKVDEIIFLAADSLRLVGILLQPFIPDKAARLLDMLGVEPSRRTIAWAEAGLDDSFGEAFEGEMIKERRVRNILFPPLDSDE